MGAGGEQRWVLFIKDVEWDNFVLVYSVWCGKKLGFDMLILCIFCR